MSRSINNVSVDSIFRKRVLDQASKDQCITLIESIYLSLTKWVLKERNNRQDKDIIKDRAYTEAKGFLWGGGRLKWQGIDELFKLKMCKIKIQQKQYLYIMDPNKLSRRRHKFLFEWAGDLIDAIHHALPPSKRRKIEILPSQQMQTPRKILSNFTPLSVTPSISNLKSSTGSKPTVNQIDKKNDVDNENNLINSQHDVSIKSPTPITSTYLNQTPIISKTQSPLQMPQDTLHSSKHNTNDTTNHHDVIQTGLIILALDYPCTTIIYLT